MNEHYWEYPDWMTRDQQKCWRLVCDLYGGEHHINSKPEPWGNGLSICVSDDGVTTYDGSTLTALVVLAHDRGVRVGIEVANFRRLRLTLYARQCRTGGHCWERHPTLEDHVKRIRRRSDDDMPVILEGNDELQRL